MVTKMNIGKVHKPQHNRWWQLTFYEGSLVDRILHLIECIRTWKDYFYSEDFLNFSWLWTSLQMQVYSWRIKLSSGETIKNELMSWIASQVPEDFTELKFPFCFQDGILFCAVVENIVSGACPEFRLLDPYQRLRNLSLAMSLLEKYLRIKPVMSPKEILQTNKKVEKKLLLLIAQIKMASEKRKVLPCEVNELNERKYQKKINCSQNCYARGMGLFFAVQGRKAYFSIFLESVRSLDLILEIRGPKNSNCIKRITTNTSWPTTVPAGKREHNDCIMYENHAKNNISLVYRILGEKICVEYVPTENGSHFLSIITRGQHIMGSPYTVNVNRSSDFSDIWPPPSKLTDDSAERFSHLEGADLEDCSYGIPKLECIKMNGTNQHRRFLRYIVKMGENDLLIEDKEKLCSTVNAFKSSLNFQLGEISGNGEIPPGEAVIKEINEKALENLACVEEPKRKILDTYFCGAPNPVPCANKANEGAVNIQSNNTLTCFISNDSEENIVNKINNTGINKFGNVNNVKQTSHAYQTESDPVLLNPSSIRNDVYQKSFLDIKHVTANTEKLLAESKCQLTSENHKSMSFHCLQNVATCYNKFCLRTEKAPKIETNKSIKDISANEKGGSESSLSCKQWEDITDKNTCHIPFKSECAADICDMSKNINDSQTLDSLNDKEIFKRMPEDDESYGKLETLLFKDPMDTHERHATEETENCNEFLNNEDRVNKELRYSENNENKCVGICLLDKLNSLDYFYPDCTHSNNQGEKINNLNDSNEKVLKSNESDDDFKIHTSFNKVGNLRKDKVEFPENVFDDDFASSRRQMNFQPNFSLFECDHDLFFNSPVDDEENGSLDALEQDPRSDVVQPVVTDLKTTLVKVEVHRSNNNENEDSNGLISNAGKYFTINNRKISTNNKYLSLSYLDMSINEKRTDDPVDNSEQSDAEFKFGTQTKQLNVSEHLESKRRSSWSDFNHLPSIKESAVENLLDFRERNCNFFTRTERIHKAENFIKIQDNSVTPKLFRNEFVPIHHNVVSKESEQSCSGKISKMNCEKNTCKSVQCEHNSKIINTSEESIKLKDLPASNNLYCQSIASDLGTQKPSENSSDNDKLKPFEHFDESSGKREIRTADDGSRYQGYAFDTDANSISHENDAFKNVKKDRISEPLEHEKSTNELGAVRCLSVRKVMQLFQKENEEVLDCWPSTSGDKLSPRKLFLENFLDETDSSEVKSTELDNAFDWGSENGNSQERRSSIKDRIKLFEKDPESSLPWTAKYVETSSTLVREKKNFWEQISS